MRNSLGGATPVTPSDAELIEAAMASEEKKRQQAVEKAARAAGETRWYLSFKDPDEITKKPQGMTVVKAGWAELDADGSSDEGERKPAGRMIFGKFKVRDF
jgi:hypothetical protein